MKQSKRKNRKPGSRSHAVKTETEKEMYGQKVRYAESEGGTEEQIRTKTSTLSTGSAYGGSESAGISDRNPIKPPLPSDRWSKCVGILAGIVAILVVVVGLSIWFTNLNNQVASNEKEIVQLDTNIKEVNSKRESLNTRMAKLEQWKDLINDDLKLIKEDVKKGVSSKEVEMKLLELEKRVLRQYKTSKTIDMK